MAKEVAAAKDRGVTHIIFGDLFLQDIRDYREAKLAGTGVTPLFPVWLLPTDKLAQDMINGGVEAYLTTCDLKKMPASFAGRRFDRGLLRDLPVGVDPCGENGEFHSFVADGPMLSKRIPVRVGEMVQREGFAYADLLPA
jgi:diphthamide synthase (EF-2-diphthine--ammonia ligase)